MRAISIRRLVETDAQRDTIDGSDFDARDIRMIERVSEAVSQCIIDELDDDRIGDTVTRYVVEHTRGALIEALVAQFGRPVEQPTARARAAVWLTEYRTGPDDEEMGITREVYDALVVLLADECRDAGIFSDAAHESILRYARQCIVDETAQSIVEAAIEVGEPAERT